jgi:serine protease Do
VSFVDNKGNKEVYELIWHKVQSRLRHNDEDKFKSETCEVYGQIHFRNNKKRSVMKSFVKSMSLVLVASVSGAAAGVFVVEKKYEALGKSVSFNSIYDYPKAYSATELSLPKSSITKVAEYIGPTVVGISNNSENFLGRVVNQFTGSGIIISSEGLIVTNYHVIEGASKISVKLSGVDTKPINATLVGVDKTSDIALIKIDMKNLPAAILGDSSKVRAGDIAIAIGNPLGEEFAGSVTQGIVSATNRVIEIADSFTKETTVYKVIQTDAAINPGNSGGPLCNELGEVIGINSLKVGKNNNVEGMGFAISSNEVKNVVNQILSQGKVSRVDLGVIGSFYEDKTITGYYVRQVYGGASEAGILPTDIILQIDGVSIAKSGQLSEILEKYKAGDNVVCKVLRDDKKVDFKITLNEK